MKTLPSKALNPETLTVTQHQQRKSKESLLDWVMNKPATGDKSAKTIATQLKSLREEWDDDHNLS